MTLYTVAFAISLAALSSCSGTDNSDYVDKSIIPPASEKVTVNPALPGTAAQNTIMLPGGTIQTPAVPGSATMMQGATPVNINPQGNVVMTPVQSPVQPTAAGMNPPHGQPNHRCDIAVGAPLNSKPAPTATQVSTEPQVTMKEVPNTQKTLPGMNPPHGEPNHRCDIAVGAPLNSKPAAPAATAAPPALLAPAKADSLKN
jgi:hypothetical protein